MYDELQHISSISDRFTRQINIVKKKHILHNAIVQYRKHSRSICSLINRSISIKNYFLYECIPLQLRYLTASKYSLWEFVWYFTWTRLILSYNDIIAYPACLYLKEFTPIHTYISVNMCHIHSLLILKHISLYLPTFFY
jgi:hypothetical protein